MPGTGMCADAIDDQRAQQKEQPPTQIGVLSGSG